MLKYVDRKYFGHNLCRAENVSGLKLCQSKWTEKSFGHYLCRQRMSQT